MLLAVLVVVLVAAALATPLVLGALQRPRRRRRRGEALTMSDPGRERRAEQRARELLRSCVNDEEWAMYRDLGFIRVVGRLASSGRITRPPREGADDENTAEWPAGGEDEGAIAERENRPPPVPRRREAPYAYLIYPHKPIVAYVPKTQRLLNEYCVEFPDLSGAITGSRLPDSDDVLAKWMALTGDERRLINSANMHLPGRQVDPGRVRRDLWRLAEWERQRRGRGPAVARRP